MNRQALYGFLIGIAVLTAAIMWFYVFVMPQPSPSPGAELPSAERHEPAIPTRESGVIESPAGDFTPPAVESDSVPPLFSQQAPKEVREELPSDVAGIDNPLGASDPDEVQRVQRELARISQTGNPSPERVATLLGDLRSAMGRDEVAGVNLARLEETVQSAGRLQSLANEMQSIANDPSKEDRQRLQEIMAEMQNIQGQVSLNADALKNVE